MGPWVHGPWGLRKKGPTVPGPRDLKVKGCTGLGVPGSGGNGPGLRALGPQGPRGVHGSRSGGPSVGAGVLSCETAGGYREADRIYIYIHTRHSGNSQTLGKLAATHAPPRVKVKPDRLQPKKPPHRESFVQSEYASMPVSVSFCTKGGGRG